jgi:hypothetical protein
VCLGFSRDGFHWHRPERRPFLPCTEKQGDWNAYNVQSAGGGCLVVGDTLYFYVSGRAGLPNNHHFRTESPTASGICSTGLAFLRRDGFASVDAGRKTGTLTTRPVLFNGKHLFVNVDAPRGELRVEILHKDGNIIQPFSRQACSPIRTDSTIHQVEWQGAKSLSRLAGKPVRFAFHLRAGKLFAFWVSPDKSGASYGYVAAGGPGFTAPIDTVGSKRIQGIPYDGWRD